MIADGVVQHFKDNGYEVVVASCEGSPDKQIEQLENFAAMGCLENILSFYRSWRSKRILLRCRRGEQ